MHSLRPFALSCVPQSIQVHRYKDTRFLIVEQYQEYYRETLRDICSNKGRGLVTKSHEKMEV